MGIARWQFLISRARGRGPSGEPLSAVTELSRALAEGRPAGLQLFEKLTGNEQLWWRCCRDAVRTQPSWLLYPDHDRALQLIRDTELVASRSAVSRAVEAVDLICQALALNTGPVSPATGLSERVARAAACWNGGAAVFMAGAASFTPQTAAASAVPYLRDQVGKVLACLENADTDSGQAMAVICALLLAADQPDTGRVVRVPVVFARPGQKRASSGGVAGTLELRELLPGPPGLFPDPRGLRNRGADSAFDTGLRLAWQFATDAGRGGRCVLWRLSLDAGVPDYAIDGGSLGAAFAIALRELLRRPRGSRPALLAVPRGFFTGIRPRCAITGVLAEQRPPAYDQLTSPAVKGPWLDEVGGMDAKLDAASAKGLRLVAPAANRASQSRITVHVDWAETIHQANRYARRVRPIRTFMAGAALVLAVGLAATTATAIGQHTAAISARDAAVANALAAQSGALADSDPLGSRVTSLAAWHIDPDPPTWQAVLDATADTDLRVIPSGGGTVSSVAFVPNGTMVAAGVADGTVRMWDVATGQPDGNPVSAGAGDDDSIAFSPDGRLLAVGGSNGTVVLRDATARQIIARLPGTDSTPVESLSFNPSGTLLAVAHGDRKIWVWNLATDRLTSAQPLPGSSAAFSPSGQTLAAGGNVYPSSGSGRYQTRLYAVPGFRPIGGPLASRYDINPEFPLAFSPDGSLLATSGGSDGAVSIWNTATGKMIRQMDVNSSGAVYAVAFSPDGQTLATGLDNGDITLWSTATGSQEGSALTGHSGIVGSMAFSPDGRTLASASNDGTLRLWNVTSQVRRPVAAPSGGLFDNALFSNDGRTLITVGYTDDEILRWDIATGRRTGPAIPGGGIALSPDGRALAVADGDRVYLWDTAGDHRSTSCVRESNTGDASDQVAFSPDGRLLATGDTAGYLQLWNPATCRPTGKLMRVSGQVSSIAFSPSGHLMAVGTDTDATDTDGSITLWNVTSHKQIGEPLTTRAVVVSDVAFSPSGNLLASASDTGLAQLWDVSTHRQVGPSLAEGTSAVFSVAFSPNGQLLATGSHNGKIQLWDVATYQQIGPPLIDDFGEVYSVAFSPSGQTLAAAADNGAHALLWDLSDIISPLRAVCDQIGGAVTPAEWRQYVPVGPAYSGACPRP